jgi:hypothetical protein
MITISKAEYIKLLQVKVKYMHILNEDTEEDVSYDEQIQRVENRIKELKDY